MDPLLPEARIWPLGRRKRRGGQSPCCCHLFFEAQLSAKFKDVKDVKDVRAIHEAIDFNHIGNAIMA